MSERRSGRGEHTVRVGLVGVGAAGIAVGAEQLLAHVPTGDWWPVVRWAAGGVLVHDLVLAPLAVVLGVLVLRRGGRTRAGAPLLPAPLLRGVLLLAASLAVLVVVQHATGAPARNPTVLPHGTAPGTLVAAALVLAVLASGALAGLRRRRARRDRRPRG